uniref:Uncharacterized protein n=1 Tax=Cacopsylla melanoneura TaxID=428564 RepID=A0A8D8ZFE0_9HEMI
MTTEITVIDNCQLQHQIIVFPHTNTCLYVYLVYSPLCIWTISVPQKERLDRYQIEFKSLFEIRQLWWTDFNRDRIVDVTCHTTPRQNVHYHDSTALMIELLNKEIKRYELFTILGIIIRYTGHKIKVD